MRPLRPHRHRTRRGARGFTMVELLVVLALAAVAMAIAIPSFRSVFSVQKRQASREIAALLRSSYEEAAVRNLQLRLVWNLDERSVAVEASDGQARIFRDREQKQAFDEWMAEKKVQDEVARLRAEDKRGKGGPSGRSEVDVESALANAGDEAGNVASSLLMGLMTGTMGGGPGGGQGRYAPNEFSPFDSPGFEKRTLPDAVFICGVWTPQHEKMLRPRGLSDDGAPIADPPPDDPEDGPRVAYTHIFPGGWMEDTVLYLCDEGATDISSLVVEPLVGRVRVEEGEAPLPDTRDRVEEE